MDSGMIGKIQKAKLYAEEPERVRFEQFRATFESNQKRLTLHPFSYFRVVSGKQDFRNRHSPELPRPGIMRSIEQTGLEGIAFGRLKIAEHSRYEPSDHVHQHQRGRFAWKDW